MEPEENPTPAVAAFVELAPGTIASDFALKNLNKALGEAQNEFEDAVKSATNTYGGWKYTPLKAIVDADDDLAPSVNGLPDAIDNARIMLKGST